MKNIRVFFFIFSFIFSTTTKAIAYDFGYADIVEPLMPAVVNINTIQNIKDNSPDPRFDFGEFNKIFKNFGMSDFLEDFPRNEKSISLGSGFIIDAEGHIVTNHHVIVDADEINIRLNNNKEYKAKLVGSDPKTDTALLKIDASEPLPFVRFGDSSKVRVGDVLIAIGNPFGLGGTVTQGIISSKSRDIDYFSDKLLDDFIQTDAAINLGNSGGPSFNVRGEVIGVNTAVNGARGGVNVGVSFAIPSNTVKEVVEMLKKHGKVERGRLGILIQELTPELVDGLNLKDDEGVLVATVDKDGAAEKAGIENGDIIISYNGTKVSSVRKLQILIAESPIAENVEIIILRQGKELKISAKTELQKPDSKNIEKSGLNNSSKITINQVEFVDLNSVLADRFSISEPSGVVILNNKSRGFWSSLKTGDLIQSVNQTPVTNSQDVQKIFDELKKDGKKNIVFLVKRSNMTIYLALPI